MKAKGIAFETGEKIGEIWYEEQEIREWCKTEGKEPLKEGDTLEVENGMSLELGSLDWIEVSKEFAEIWNDEIGNLLSKTFEAYTECKKAMEKYEKVKEETRKILEEAKEEENKKYILVKDYKTYINDTWNLEEKITRPTYQRIKKEFKKDFEKFFELNNHIMVSQSRYSKEGL